MSAIADPLGRSPSRGRSAAWGKYVRGTDVEKLGRERLAVGVRVRAKIHLKSNFLRLDCALGLVREGLLIACREALSEGLPSVLRDWECIDVTEDEAMRLGTNGLPISPTVYLTDPAFRRIGDAIARRGVQIDT